MADEAREIKPFAFLDDPDEKVFDFRPQPVAADEDTEETPDPKGLSAQESADYSDLVPVESSEKTVSAAKVSGKLKVSGSGLPTS